MDIRMDYYGNDFWGRTVLRYDWMYGASIDKLRKCFDFLRNNNAAVHITNYNPIHTEAEIVLFWDMWSDHEVGELTVKRYERWNSCDSEKMSFRRAKKMVMDELKEKAGLE